MVPHLQVLNIVPLTRYTGLAALDVTRWYFIYFIIPNTVPLNSYWASSAGRDMVVLHLQVPNIYPFNYKFLILHL